MKLYAHLNVYSGCLVLFKHLSCVVNANNRNSALFILPFFQHLALPGVHQGDLKNSRKFRQFYCWQLFFAQNGQYWFAATSHGLFVYLVDTQVSKICTCYCLVLRN